MHPTEPEAVMDETIEARAKQRVQARSSFLVHVIIFATMNAAFAAIWLVTGHGYPWFLWPTLMWGVGLVAHLVTLWTGPGSLREERAVEREIQRLRNAHP
jgi:hypothetical protein